MSDSSSVVRRTITRTVRTLDGGEPGDDVVIRRANTYNVYRGMSPTTSSRLELRLRELEDALEAEREGRMRVSTGPRGFAHSIEIPINSGNSRRRVTRNGFSEPTPVACVDRAGWVGGGAGGRRG
ncbi:hypothetical protein LSAT2_013670 [Lamellibrachia satsuma]|nr:hypothetical protein LSAT2_013670 [Lamellibrachia satsuma]